MEVGCWRARDLRVRLCARFACKGGRIACRRWILWERELDWELVRNLAAVGMVEGVSVVVSEFLRD